MLKNTKTNLKYLLIVFILAAIVGGGISYYSSFVNKEIYSLTRFPGVKKPEITKKNETADWKTYRNEEYGFEFDYPKDWGDLTLKLEKNNETFIFDTQNEKIRIVLYYKLLKNIIFITQGGKYEFKANNIPEMYGKILKIILPNKEIKTIYTFVPLAIFREEQYWDSVVKNHIEDFYFSPNGKYIAFMSPGWDYSTPFIIDIYSGMNILNPVPDCVISKDETSGEIIKSLDCDIWYDEISKSVYWSPSSKVLAIRSFILPFGSVTLEGLFVSDYGNPEKLKPIVCLHENYEKCGILPLNIYLSDINIGDIAETFNISNIYFTNDENLFFSVLSRGETIKYEYNTKTEEFKELK